MIAFSIQLKKLYQNTSLLELNCLADSGEPDESCIIIKGSPSVRSKDLENARWKKVINDHKM
jgi:hypothetical protein